MVKTENFEQVQVESPAQLRTWLQAHHAQPDSVWLVTFKKAPGQPYVSRDEVLDELLCFGWIDGLRRKLDAERTMQLISPRKAQHWARSYKERAARLIAEGRMAPAGLASIDASKANGMWHFMDDVDARIVPPDFQQALAQQAPAEQVFNGFPPAVQRFTLRWIKLAKSAPARARRIEKAARLAAQGQRILGT